ncbi:hypothetical protein CPC08DRAFT_51205 [Agrocybe pediades]|nr:hypothetical protein CPC08DRAFT_51205 [Agrocybe pediades]
MTFGSVINGRVLDIEYRRFREKIEALRSAEKGGQSVDINREENFPLEMARLRVMPLYVILMVAACAGNGWCIQRRVSIAVPLILQFIVGYTSISLMNGVSTLMIDLVPGQRLKLICDSLREFPHSAERLHLTIARITLYDAL